MTLKQLLPCGAKEKPLDVIKDDGGFTSIFRTIAVIGDSLASGDLESLELTGERGFHDFYDVSWGQFLARMSGTTVYNFSKGGMTAIQYIDSFAAENGFWDSDKAAQAYILALGCNDLGETDQEVGSVADIDPDYRKNKRTFAGCFATIIQRYKEIQPDGVFFLVTMPKELPGSMPETIEKRYDAHQKIMYDMAEYFSNTYVIDLAEYAPVQDDEFKKLFYTGGHLNVAGYYTVAKMIGSYIDYIVRHDLEKFNKTGLIGTPFKYCG